MGEVREGKIIIGVAKSKFQDCEYSSVPILRGQSKNPLWVSSAGVDSIVAASWIRDMYGDYRLPKLLKDLDRLTKNITA